MSDEGMDYRCDKFDVAECSRCKKDLSELMRLNTGNFTAGYYELSQGPWNAYANEGERYLCDACMFKDPRYIAVYGEHQP